MAFLGVDVAEEIRLGGEGVAKLFLGVEWLDKLSLGVERLDKKQSIGFGALEEYSARLDGASPSAVS